MKRATALLIFFLCQLIAVSAFGATVILKSGKMIEGKIIERTAQYIKVESHGVRLTTYLDEIESIDGRLLDSSQDTSQNSPFNLKDPEQIFADTSIAIVYVITSEAAGERFLGGGFIASPEGAIVTSFHILENVKDISVKLKDGSTYPALGVVYQDSLRDLCILKINAQNLPVISLGDSNSVKTGERSFRMGNPIGLEYSFTDCVSRAKKSVNGVQWLQFTTQGTTDNVGGPLINAKGEAIGLVTYLAADDRSLNFALASNDIKPFIEKPPVLLSDAFKKITPADYYLREGFVEFLRGEIDSAIALYEKAIAMNPMYAQAYNNRGNAYEKKGLLDQAISDYTKALVIDPGSAEAYLNRATAFVSGGKADLAISDYTTAIGLAPENAYAYFSRGNSFFLTGDYNQAIADYTATLQIDPNRAQAYYNRGFVYAAKNDYDQAIVDYNKAIEIDSGYADVYVSRALAYGKKGNVNQALADYTKAMELNPNLASAYYGRARVYLTQQQYDSAWVDVRKARELGVTIDPGLLEALKKASGREE